MEQQDRPAKLTAESLLSVKSFSELDHEARGAIAARCSAHRYDTGQSVVSHNDESTDVFFIVSGQVRVTHYSSGGKEVTFRDLGAGESFGELSAVDGRKRSAHVVTLENSFIGSMSSREFWQILQDYPGFAESTMRRLSELVRLLSDRVIEFSTLGVKNRIHAELLRLARENMVDAHSAEVEPIPTHAEIANRVSTHREAVTRELNALAHKGLIERRKKSLLIHDVEQLSRMVRDVTGE